MKGTKIAKNVLWAAREPLETLNKQVTEPIFNEAIREIKGFFGNPQEIAKEDLQRAREKQTLDEIDQQDVEISQEAAQRVSATIKQAYNSQEIKSRQEQDELKEEFVELREEIAKLAETAGLETKAHLENTPKKIGVLDIKRLQWIIRLLRIEAAESKSAQELVLQRANAKRTTGMLAWVSGKQMKIYEQGTLQLQG